MSPRLRVVVLGAGGEMGRRVCRLAGQAPGARVVGASRSGRGPAGVAMERADVRDAASVACVVRAGDLVVNCVGPYDYDPAPLVAASVTARAHYADLADDATFAASARTAARASGAQAAGVFVCTGASTVPGLAGVFASAFASSPRASEIARVVAYLNVGSGNPVSAGLLASLLAPLGRGLPEGGACFAEMRTLAAGDGRTLRFGAYPAPFVEQRVAIGARTVPARFFFGFDRSAITALLHLASPTVARIAPPALRRISRAFLPFVRAASLLGTPLGVLAVCAEDAAGAEVGRVELSARTHGLDIPAAPPAWIAARLAGGAALPGGPAELCDLVPLADVVGWARADSAYALRATGGAALPA
jgi:hypothetical protein